MKKRGWMILLIGVLMYSCTAHAAPWIEEKGLAADGSAWSAVCFADELPPLLQGVIQEPTISGASVELPAQGAASAMMITAAGRVLACARTGEGTWGTVDLTEMLQGSAPSVGLHDREGKPPVFCVFNAHRSGLPTWHVEYTGGAFQITEYTAEEHQQLISAL